MFIGHHATAFALKPIAPRVSLGTLFAATILLGLIWPILILLGIEDVRIAPGITALRLAADGGPPPYPQFVVSSPPPTASRQPTMFIGHHATAFALKPIAPRVSLGTLFAATILLDLIWPILILLGIEDVRVAPGITAFTPLDFYKYPVTHSLVAVLGWSIAGAIVYWLVRKSARDAILVGIAVLSHWIVDFIAHRPDLPLWPGGPKTGLGLWHSIPGTIVVEVGFFLAGLALYLRATRARDRTGSIALWSLVVFLGVIYVANLTSPPPPNAKSIALAGLAQWLFVPWGVWIDRRRSPASRQPPTANRS